MLTKRELELTEQTAQQWVRVGDLFHRIMGERTLSLIEEVRQFRHCAGVPGTPVAAIPLKGRAQVRKKE
jgi:hypothetical protein